jgi:hypothetical protein
MSLATIEAMDEWIQAHKRVSSAVSHYDDDDDNESIGNGCQSDMTIATLRVHLLRVVGNS